MAMCVCIHIDVSWQIEKHVACKQKSAPSQPGSPQHRKITGNYEPLNRFSEEYFAHKDKLELEPARDLYNQLKGDSPLLSFDRFIAWDDIQDVLTRDVVDLNTVKIILKEIGVKSFGIHLNQFVEAVELVNQVSAIEEDWGEEGENEDNEDYDEAFLREIEILEKQPEDSYLQ
ncbi:hypothetical protein EON63_11760 [archaeon]|nr:MAG: hypothetical protein EON63_11760 [archaeon]